MTHEIRENCKVLKKLSIPGYLGFSFLVLNKNNSSNAIMIELNTMSENAVKYCKDRIEMHKQLNHPNICTFMSVIIESRDSGYGYDSERIYLLIEEQQQTLLDYLQGIHDLDQQQKLSKIFEIFIQVQNAVIYCHSKNIVLDQIMPQYIFIQQHKNGICVKLSNVISTYKLFCENHQTDIGESNYAAPELIESYGQKTNSYSDTWSSGCLLYRMVVGKDILEGKDKYFLLNTCEQIVISAMKNIQIQSLQQFIRNFLVKDPKKRFTDKEIIQKCNEFVNSIKNPNESKEFDQQMIILNNKIKQLQSDNTKLTNQIGNINYQLKTAISENNELKETLNDRKQQQDKISSLFKSILIQETNQESPLSNAEVSSADFKNVGPLGAGINKVIKVQLKSDVSKVFAMKLVTEDAETEKRGTEFAINLHHRNILQIYAMFTEAQGFVDVFFIIMELGNSSLSSYIEKWKNNPIAVDSNIVLQYFYQIMQGVNYCHQQKVVHRDLKPENILIVMQFGKEVLKISDFGTVQKIKSSSLKSIRGTKPYMSPEIIQGQSHGAPTDIWSCGCILFEMCACKKLFDAGEADAGPLVTFGFDKNQLKSYLKIQAIQDCLTKYIQTMGEKDRVLAEELVKLIVLMQGESVMNLIQQMIKTDQKQRVTAEAIAQQLEQLDCNKAQEENISDQAKQISEILKQKDSEIKYLKEKLQKLQK